MKKITKLRIFDFDDTLCNTNSKVFVTKVNGDIITLSSDEFATYVIETEDVINFKDFDEIVEPEVRKHRIVLQKMLYSKNNKIVICTARAKSAKRAIVDWLVTEFGKKAYGIEVICLGDSDPESKADVAEEYIRLNEDITELYFADDAWPNVRAVGDRISQYDVKLKLQKV